MALFKRRAKAKATQEAVEFPPEASPDNEVDGAEYRLPALTWQEAEETLLQADLGVATTNQILELAKLNHSGEVAERLRLALMSVLTPEVSGSGVSGSGMSDQEASAPGASDPEMSALGASDPELSAPKMSRSLSLQGAPAIWLVVGVNGVGKTTSVAKLAKAQQDQGRRVVLAAADTFRAAAIDQLQSWSDKLEVPLVKGAPGGDPAAVVFDAVEHAAARKCDLVIADTAGRMHTKDNLMEELQKVLRVANKSQGTVSEILLVIDSTTGQNGISQARVFTEAVQPTGVILTKLDGSSKGGVVVAVQQELSLPVKLIGVGEGLFDLKQFAPDSFAVALLGGA